MLTAVPSPLINRDNIVPFSLEQCGLADFQEEIDQAVDGNSATAKCQELRRNICSIIAQNKFSER